MMIGALFGPARAEATPCQTLPGSAVRARIPARWAANPSPEFATQTDLTTVLQPNHRRVDVTVKTSPGRGTCDKYVHQFFGKESGLAISESERPALFSPAYARFWSRSDRKEYRACASGHGQGDALFVNVDFYDDTWTGDESATTQIREVTDAAIAGWNGACDGDSHNRYIAAAAATYSAPRGASTPLGGGIVGDLHETFGQGTHRFSVAIEAEAGGGGVFYARGTALGGYMLATGPYDFALLVGGGVDAATWLTSGSMDITVPPSALAGVEFVAGDQLGRSTNLRAYGQLMERLRESSIEASLTLVLQYGRLTVGLQGRHAVDADSFTLFIGRGGGRRHPPD